MNAALLKSVPQLNTSIHRGMASKRIKVHANQYPVKVHTNQHPAIFLNGILSGYACSRPKTKTPAAALAFFFTGVVFAFATVYVCHGEARKVHVF